MGDVTYYVLPGLKELQIMEKVPIGKYLTHIIFALKQSHQKIK